MSSCPADGAICRESLRSHLNGLVLPRKETIMCKESTERTVIPNSAPESEGSTLVSGLTTDEIFEKDIRPLLNNICTLCIEYHIPYHASFFTKGANGEDYEVGSGLRPKTAEEREEVGERADDSLAMHHWVTNSNGDIDNFMFYALKEADRNKSVFLQILDLLLIQDGILKDLTRIS